MTWELLVRAEWYCERTLCCFDDEKKVLLVQQQQKSTANYKRQNLIRSLKQKEFFINIYYKNKFKIV
jgi:hypothetical protein